MLREISFIFAENLILATLFVVPYPESTTVLQGIATTCPRLLNNVLPKSEQFEFAVVDPG